jgi:hypothetical protein
VDRPPCGGCRKVYDFKNLPPPCEKCFPGVHERNRKAFELWRMVSGQWRFSFNGPAAMDIVAVESCLKINSIGEENSVYLANQLLTIGEVILAEWQRKQPGTKTH